MSGSMRRSLLLASLLAGLCRVTAELLHVTIVARAGPRMFYPNTDYRTSMVFGGPPLLSDGYTMMELFGAELRLRYLGEDAETPLRNLTSTYRKHDIMVRSMMRDQTVSSADALLYGLYPPLPANARIQPLSGGLQVVPVFTIPRDMDFMLRGYETCPAFDTRIQRWYDSDEFKNMENQTFEFRKFLSETFRFYVQLKDVPQLYERVLLFRKYGDVEGPQAQTPYLNATTFQRLKTMADWVETTMFSPQVAGTLCGGPLLGRIVERMGWVAGNSSAGAAENSGPPPLFIFMGLDKTIECLIAAMNLTDAELTTQKVPHGGALLFEVHRIDEQYYVRTLYRNGLVPKMYRTLLLSGTAGMTCTNTGLCPVDEFNKLIRPEDKTFGQDEWCQTCNAFNLPSCYTVAASMKAHGMKQPGGRMTDPTMPPGSTAPMGAQANNKGHSKKGHGIGPEVAAAIGILVGVCSTVVVMTVVPWIRYKLATRRTYHPQEDVGIEAAEIRSQQGAGGDII